MNFLKVMELCQTSRDQVIIKVGQNNFSENFVRIFISMKSRQTVKLG